MPIRPGLSAVLAGFLLAAAAKSGNMNGRYTVASGGRFGVAFNDDYASKGHEFFDVWAPEIATHYGEVFWTDQGNQPLPPEVVRRFEGRVIAITGYEQDQVMVEPAGHPGQDPSRDVSVPIHWAYNHHYMFWITGRHSELRKLYARPGDPMAHGAATKLEAFDLPSAARRADPSIPTSSWFSEGNGGESRKSFHGYPEGFAQLVESPTTWHLMPMQIDTRNRDCGAGPKDVGNCTKFTPGPEPRQARWGRGVPEGTNYSGLLECPCNSRYGGDPAVYPGTRTKATRHDYVAVTAGACPTKQDIRSAAACFGAAQTLGVKAKRFTNASVSDPGLPPSCSFVEEPDGTARVYFNADGRAPCNGGTRLAGSVQSGVNVSLGLDLDGSGLFERSPPGKYCEGGPAAFLRAFPTGADSLSAARDARDACEQYCLSDHACWGCSADCPGQLSYGVLSRACQWNAVASCDAQADWAGSIPGDITRKNSRGGLATITVSGPADVWFGVGLNATAMCDLPYALIVDDTGVVERKLGTCGDEGCHCGGTLLAPSVKVLSNTVANQVRTVVMTRPFQGLTPEHYTFNPHQVGTIPVVTATGSSFAFAHHRAKAPAKLTLTTVGAATCVCDAGAVGELCHAGGKDCAQFVKHCVPAPAGDLVTQKNPTCSSASYLGGLSCCGHRRILLDDDQEVRPELLRYHMKFRFWFQEYSKDPASGRPSHYNLVRFYFQTEANAGEYDVPPAFALPGEALLGYPGLPPGEPTPGTACTGTCPGGPDCDCTHTITYRWTTGNMRLIYAGGHCHAPRCISIELYRNDTGTPQLLCRQLPAYGQGRFPGDKFDEAGYVALPPCLWGTQAEDLEPPPWLPAGTPLVSVKKVRNTDAGHFGDMASWQMRGVQFPARGTNYV